MWSYYTCKSFGSKFETNGIGSTLACEVRSCIERGQKQANVWIEMALKIKEKHCILFVMPTTTVLKMQPAMKI